MSTLLKNYRKQYYSKRTTSWIMVHFHKKYVQYIHECPQWGLILRQKHMVDTFPFGRFVFKLVSVIWFHGKNNVQVNNGAETESAEFGALEQQNISDDSQLDGGIFPHKCCKDT